MGAFTGLKDATRGFSSNYCREGEFLVRIDANEMFDYTNADGLACEMWKSTCTVLGVIAGDHRVGEVVHMGIRFGGKVPKDTSQSNLKGFIAGVLGCEDEQIGEPEAIQCLSEESPLTGQVCVVKARNRASKKSRGKDGEPIIFTDYSWEEALTPEQIREALPEDVIAKFFPNGL